MKLFTLSIIAYYGLSNQPLIANKVCTCTTNDKLCVITKVVDFDLNIPLIMVIDPLTRKLVTNKTTNVKLICAENK